MKTKAFSLFLILLSITTTLKSQEAVISVKSFLFDLTDKIPSNLIDPKDVNRALRNSVSHNLMYHANGIDHIVNILGGTKEGPGIHFINKNGNWEFEGYYSDVLMDGARSYTFLDRNGNFVYSSSGTEEIYPWPLGHIVQVKTIGEKLKWQQVSLHRAHYDNLSNGDLNNDGLPDLVAMHMGTDGNGWYGVDGLLTYTQNSDSTFSEARDLISDPSQWGDNTWPGTHHNGAVLVADIMGDKRPEIIRADYGFDRRFPSDRYGLAIFKFNPTINKYQFAKTVKDLGIFKDSSQGATSMVAADFNNDGFLDIAVATEGEATPGKGVGMVQVWLNNNNGDLTPGQAIIFESDSLSFREFEVADVNQDGLIDIILHAGGGVLAIGKPPYDDGFFTNLKYSIWLNRGNALFSTISHDLKLSKHTVPTKISPQTSALKGFFINGNLRFFGYHTDCNSSGCNVEANSFYLIDATIKFCNKIVKPTFNTSNFSFCNGDSLNISIANANPGDSIKWYFGNKVDFTNTTSKRFGDTTTLYVIRKDSIGCTISSDTIKLTKHPAIQSSFTVNNTSQCLSGNNFAFTNTSTISSGNLTHVWSFGDGTNATSQNSTRTYASAGLFDVKLITTSNAGCKDSIIRQITVHPMPAVSLSINNAAQCLASNNFAFTNTSTISSGTLTHAWIFGDGGSATTANASRAYAAVGNYDVKLVTTSSFGCRDSITRQVTVHPMPAKPTINWDGINLSTASTYASYQWLLNNSTVTGANAAEHKPVNPGSYRVRITNTPGCADTSDAFNLVVTAAGRVTQNQNKVAVYPNPAISSVFIDLGKSPSQPVSVQLLTIEGRPMTNWIMQQQRQEFAIDHIQNGTYLIQIVEGKTKTIHKVVIQTP